MRDKSIKWKVCASQPVMFIKEQRTVCTYNQQEGFGILSVSHTLKNTLPLERLPKEIFSAALCQPQQNYSDFKDFVV